jgi:ribonuclease HI
MTLEFQNTLHRTRREMLAAVASEWLSAGGSNSRDTMIDELQIRSDASLAAEAIELLGLDQPENEDSTETWMEKRGVERADLVEAFHDLRRDFDKRFPAEAA